MFAISPHLRYPFSSKAYHYYHISSIVETFVYKYQSDHVLVRLSVVMATVNTSVSYKAKKWNTWCCKSVNGILKINDCVDIYIFKLIEFEIINTDIL